MVAEATAKELPQLGLADALQLTLLIARKDPRRHPRVAARWLLRYLEEAGPDLEQRNVIGAGAEKPRDGASGDIGTTNPGGFGP